MREFEGDLAPTASHTMTIALSRASSPPPQVSAALNQLLQGLRPQHPEPRPANGVCWQVGAQPAPGQLRYAHQRPERGIAFTVENHPFASAQVLDPRVVRIAPGACNEKHRHAHESLFVVLEGVAELQVGAHIQVLTPGSVAFVPRWVMHQTSNPSQEQPLLLLAITDFGFSSSVLGDYDARTRLQQQGEALQ